MPKIEPTFLSPTGVDLDKLDSDAVRATQRLSSRGFEAFLVGGCVRDLLLDRQPKDYDIATSARPQQVKRTFPRNCRIIGRRFKLAHLHFDRNTKILEVSTFRRTPEADGEEDDLLITRDNEFGTAEEDALRRDFTVNALFLDPTKDRILDWCDGLRDLDDRIIRTIGDPRVRFREDPVRILRAAKFAGRLGFSIEPETFAAMAETAGDLVRAAPPRLLEEILRLLRGGHALDSFQLLRDVGALKSLLPALANFLAEADHQHRVDFWRLLEALDRRVQSGQVPQNAVLLGVLLVGPVLAAAEAAPDRSPSSISEELLGPLSQELKLPRRDAGCLKRICGVQHRFVQSDEKKRFRVTGFVRGPYFHEALELFQLRIDAEAADPEALGRWQGLAEEHAPAAEIDEEQPAPKRRRRRRTKQRASEPAAEADVEPEAIAAHDDAADVIFGAEPPAIDDLEGAEGEQGADAETDTDEQDADPGKRRRRRRRRRSKAKSDDGDGVDELNGDDATDTPAAEEKAAKKTVKKRGKTAKKTKAKSKAKAKKSKRRTRRGAVSSDVDVVPRSRDRRGKVEVIEPAPLDVSAFDVELDPKRVPTFGTIVEGKSRPKRRTPRIREDGVDDYKPPPPPGGEDDPSKPPKDPDTFGDW